MKVSWRGRHYLRFRYFGGVIVCAFEDFSSKAYGGVSVCCAWRATVMTTGFATVVLPTLSSRFRSPW